VSYYRPPMGDYKTYGYAGDPGFLSSLWKGIKAVGKVMLGVPAKPISVPGTIAAGAGTGMALAPFYGGPAAPGVPRGMGATGPAMYGAGGSGFGPPGMQTIQVPRGYHFAKDGSGRVVKNRRMNVANPRALRKAMRRVQGFEKLAKRTITFTKRVRMKR